jgi:hypothetical protein
MIVKGVLFAVVRTHLRSMSSAFLTRLKDSHRLESAWQLLMPVVVIVAAILMAALAS